MGSLFGALGKLGEDYGKAAESTRLDSVTMAKLAQQLHYQNARLQLTQQLRDTQQQNADTNQSRLKMETDSQGWDKAFTFTGKGPDGSPMKMQFNPVKGIFRPYQEPSGFLADNSDAGKMRSAEETLGRPLTDQEKARKLGVAEPVGATPYEVKQDKTGMYVYVPKNPDSGLKPVHTGVMGPLPKVTGGNGFGDADPDTLKQSKPLMAMAQRLRDDGREPPAKWAPFVDVIMQDQGWKPKLKLSAADGKSVNLINQLQPKVDRLKEFLESNNLTDSNNLVFGDHSRLNIEKAWQLYSHGVAPSDPVTANLIRNAAALKVMGAAPWVIIGRGKYLYDDITKHLPDPHDTPKNLYDKIQFFQTVLDDSKSALPEGAINAQQSGLDAALDKAFGKKKK